MKKQKSIFVIEEYLHREVIPMKFLSEETGGGGG